MEENNRKIEEAQRRLVSQNIIADMVTRCSCKEQNSVCQDRIFYNNIILLEMQNVYMTELSAVLWLSC